MTALLWVNLIALVVVGGVVCLYALIPFAMANDDPACGPLVRHGLLQIPAWISWWVWLVLGVRQAWSGFTTTGWSALGAGALGWGIWLGGAAASMVAFAVLAWVDMRLAGRRARRRSASR